MSRILLGVCAAVLVFWSNARSSQEGQLVAEAKLEKIRGSSEGGSVLDVGRKGGFDSEWVTCPTVHFDGNVYRMWYSTLYDSKMGRGGIGLATSKDAIHWVREGQGSPVLEVGAKDAFDGGQVMGPEVLFDGKQYRMWYTGMALQWHRSGAGHYRIGLATSTDGIHWTRANDGRSVVDLGPEGAPDEVQAATPSILPDTHGYRMWYAAWAPKTEHTICVARSHDGLHWRRENEGQPVIGLAPSYAYGPAVCRWNDQYLLLYMSHAKPSPGLYAALSQDGIHWSMLNRGEPVLYPGSGADFDEYLVGHPFLLNTGGTLRAWYTGYRRETEGVRGWKLRIGLAELQEKGK